MTTEILGGTVTNFLNMFTEFSKTVVLWKEERQFIEKERIKYTKLGDLLDHQLQSMTKQSEGMLNLNVLSTYIHQTILELRDAEVSLKVLIETTDLNTRENNKATKQLMGFIKNTSELLIEIKQGTSQFIQSEKEMKLIKEDLDKSEFQVLQIKAELNKMEELRKQKEMQLSLLEKEILDITMETKLKSKLISRKPDKNSKEASETLSDLEDDKSQKGSNVSKIRQKKPKKLGKKASKL